MAFDPVMEVLSQSNRTKVKVVEEGVISLDGYRSKTPSQLVVAVHPYYGCEYFVDEDTDFPLDYPRRMDELMKTYDGPIVTLEGVTTLDRTVSRCLRLGRLEDRVFVATQTHSPEPLAGWERLIGLVRRFKGRPLRFVGGYLFQTHSMPGCLGRTADRFRDTGLRFDFSFDLIYPHYSTVDDQRLIETVFKDGSYKEDAKEMLKVFRRAKKLPVIRHRKR